MKRATSSAADRRRSGGARGSEGFALVELTVLLAIAGLLAAIALPRGVGALRASEIRTLAADLSHALRADRNAALASGRSLRTEVDLAGRRVVSASTGRVVVLPADVGVELVQSSREDTDRGGGIRFGPRGQGSGGAIVLRRADMQYRIDVNWSTSRVTTRSWPAAAVSGDGR